MTYEKAYIEDKVCKVDGYPVDPFKVQIYFNDEPIAFVTEANSTLGYVKYFHVENGIISEIKEHGKVEIKITAP